MATFISWDSGLGLEFRSPPNSEYDRKNEFSGSGATLNIKPVDFGPDF